METHQQQQQAYGYAQQLVETYFRMLTAGCGEKATCSNANCRSNRNFKVMSPTDAAIRSIYFATRAPVSLCMPLVPPVASYIQQSMPSSAPEEEEEGPETDDVDDQSPAKPSTPRRRLSSAVRLDLNINFTTEANDDGEEDRDGEPARESELNAQNNRALSTDGRKLSLPKQKLLEAIQKRFPASQVHNQLQR